MSYMWYHTLSNSSILFFICTSILFFYFMCYYAFNELICVNCASRICIAKYNVLRTVLKMGQCRIFESTNMCAPRYGESHWFIDLKYSKRQLKWWDRPESADSQRHIRQVLNLFFWIDRKNVHSFVFIHRHKPWILFLHRKSISDIRFNPIER